MKKAIPLLTAVIVLIVVACEREESSILEINPISAADCELSYSDDANQYVMGICLDGIDAALPNETTTFVSKATANFTEILWTVESGSIELISVETSMDNSIEIGRLKTIATITFNSDFSGGSLKAEATNNAGEYAAMHHQVDMKSNQ